MKNFELEVDGMTCVNCAASIDKYLENCKVNDIYVNFSTKEVRFSTNDPDFDVNEIIDGIKLLGYNVKGYNKPSFWTLRRKLVFAAVFTLPLFLNHILMMFGLGVHFLMDEWVQLALASPVYILGFLHFGKSALASLKMGVPNMDVLIFVGSTAAFFYSLMGMYYSNPDFIFFETSSTIITLVLLGNLLEEISISKTTSAIDDLNNLKTEYANRKMKSGTVLKFPVDDLIIEHIVIVNEGDTIPADGIIISGEAEIDEAFITGESIPVYKSVDDSVVGAAIVTSGSIEVEVTAIGRDSYLGNMIELVKSAQMNKPEIQKLADKISAIFVPAVILISILTFLISYFGFNVTSYDAFSRAIAVLVISCPCAMGLATPTAVMVGVGRLTKMGIMVKGGQTLESLSAVKDFFFDKTGTLTDGKFEINHIDYINEYSESEKKALLSICYNIEKKSSHPIAESIVSELRLKFNIYEEIDFTRFKEIKGQGLEVFQDDGKSWFLGRNIDDDGHVISGIALYENKTKKLVIHIKDALREKVGDVISYLNDLNIKSHVLSGDNLEKVESMSRELGISSFKANQSPQDKLTVLETYRKKNPIAMVGDGINDSAALAMADVGISLSSSTNIAMQSADIVLINDKLQFLMPLIRISKLTMKTIRENLFWAFGYNVIAIPIAAMGYLTPMWGALFMAFSDIIVIGNSIRLNNR